MWLNSQVLIDSSINFTFCLLFFIFLKKIINYSIDDKKAPAIAIMLRSISLPLLYLPWLIFIFIQLRNLSSLYFSEYTENIILSKKITFLLYPSWIFWNISLKIKLLLKTANKRWASNVSYLTIARIIQLIVVVVTVVGLAQFFGYSLSGFLAFGGVGGIIIGLAAKDWLANFFGGLMLMVDRPFSEGDWIKSPDKNLEGHVESVGWRLTRIRTFDRRPIYVPNALFNGIIIENPTRMSNRRMIENFGLRYEDIDKLPKIFSKIIDFLMTANDLDLTEPYYVKFMKYDDSSLLCQIRIHITQTSRVGFLSVQEKVLFAIAKIVKEEQADFAYPTRRVIADESYKTKEF